MLLILEGLVRWIAPAPVIPGIYISDPVLWHAMRPHVRVIYRTTGFRTVIQTNADGFRDLEFGPKSAAAYRILGIGDSFTLGAEVPARDTYPKVLERRLRERPDGDRFEVFNLGVRAYGTLQELRVLETRGLSYQPDLVILQVSAATDLYESLQQIYTVQAGQILPLVAHRTGAKEMTATPAMGEATTREDLAGKGSGGGLKRWMRRHSQLYLFARTRFRALMKRARGESAVAPNPAMERYAMAVYARTETDTIRAGWARVDSLMQSLANLSVRQGFRVVVMNVPASLVVSRIVKRTPATDGADFDPLKPDRVVHDMAERYGFLYVSLLPRLTEATRRGQVLYWPEDGHWTKAGHRLAAESLYETMQASGVIRD